MRGSDREGTVANGGTACYWNVKCCCWCRETERPTCY